MEGYRADHAVSDHITTRTHGNIGFYTVLNALIA